MQKNCIRFYYFVRLNARQIIIPKRYTSNDNLLVNYIVPFLYASFSASNNRCSSTMPRLAFEAAMVISFLVPLTRRTIPISLFTRASASLHRSLSCRTHNTNQFSIMQYDIFLMQHIRGILTFCVLHLLTMAANTCFVYAVFIVVKVFESSDMSFVALLKTPASSANPKK